MVLVNPLFYPFCSIPAFSPCLRGRFFTFGRGSQFLAHPPRHKQFVANKHQSAIRQDSHKTVDAFFYFCFEAESRHSIGSPEYLLFAQPSWNQQPLTITPSLHRLRGSAEGHNPKMQKPGSGSVTNWPTTEYQRLAIRFADRGL